ncbi:MAG: N-acetyltransferase [Verrucomicrobiaceae bacterium]|nr:MAG: N-acetyltransferase [Verrucomicrobiaceae bacterium]
MFTPIHTPRLTLRPATMEDADFIQAHFSLPEVLEFLPPEVPNPYPADGANFYLSQIMLPAMEDGTGVEYIIETKDAGTPVGTVMFEAKNEDRTVWRIGFWLAPSHQGKGYVTEASQAAMHWLFNSTPATEVVTGNAATNTASARIQQKNGFLPKGTVVQMPPFRNGDTVAEQWSLPKDHFLALHAGK